MSVESASAIPDLVTTAPLDSDLFREGAAHIRLVKQVMKAELIRGTFTPTVTFATPGDFVPTYSIQQGFFIKNRTMLLFCLRLGWSNNAYTTAASTFRIDGFPYAASALIATQTMGIGRAENITISTGHQDHGLLFTAGSTIASLSATRSGILTATSYGTTQLPASRANILLECNGMYLVE